MLCFAGKIYLCALNVIKIVNFKLKYNICFSSPCRIMRVVVRRSILWSISKFNVLNEIVQLCAT